jgi:cyclopropane-fatty-acyl-phospholipid synthase
MCKADVNAQPQEQTTPRRVAVIGGGVAGLSAAWHLQTNTSDTVQLFEAEERLGGHAYTVKVGETDVDIGFMVFNDSNYPNMVQWFDKLDVKTENSDMSLSVSLDKGNTVEWSSDGLNGLLARRSQLLEPSFHRMVLDMMRFHKEAPSLLLLQEDDPRKHVTSGQYLRNHGYSESFGRNYLLPMMAALWSASMDDVLQFPACQLISFLCNHKMLQLLDRPQVSRKKNKDSPFLSNKVEAGHFIDTHFPLFYCAYYSSGRQFRIAPKRTL